MLCEPGVNAPLRSRCWLGCRSGGDTAVVSEFSLYLSSVTKAERARIWNLVRGGISNRSQISVFAQARPPSVDQGRGARQKKCTGSYFDGGLEDNELTERQPGRWLCFRTLFRLQLKRQKPTEGRQSGREWVAVQQRRGERGGGGALGLAVACRGCRERGVHLLHTCT